MRARSGSEGPALAPTPPMGWNSWDCYGAAITEAQFKANVDCMAARLARYGWQYAVIDIQWYQPEPPPSGYPETDDLVMDQHGRLLPAPNRFPSAAGGAGFRPLADYTHSRGLKFGVHIMRGIPRPAVKRNLPILGASGRAADVADRAADVADRAADMADRAKDCPWCQNMWGMDMSRPGAQAYYDSIVRLYADWTVDYIKADDMSQPYRADEIEGLSAAIRKCGRPIVLSLSPGATPISQAEHLKRHAQLWRISPDLWDNWEPDQPWAAGLKDEFALCAQWAPHAGPGHWPDPDMLPLGHISLSNQQGPDRQSRLTRDEQVSMMTLWCVARAPLMFGGALPDLDPFTLSLLTNEEVLAVNQHGAGNRELWRRGDLVAWTADAPDGRVKYLAAFNLGEAPAAVEVPLSELGLSGAYAARDLWSRQGLGPSGTKLTAEVAAHGSRLFRLCPK